MPREEGGAAAATGSPFFHSAFARKRGAIRQGKDAINCDPESLRKSCRSVNFRQLLGSSLRPHKRTQPPISRSVSLCAPRVIMESMRGLEEPKLGSQTRRFKRDASCNDTRLARTGPQRGPEGHPRHQRRTEIARRTRQNGARGLGATSEGPARVMEGRKRAQSLGVGPRGFDICPQRENLIGPRQCPVQILRWPREKIMDPSGVPPN